MNVFVVKHIEHFMAHRFLQTVEKEFRKFSSCRKFCSVQNKTDGIAEISDRLNNAKEDYSYLEEELGHTPVMPKEVIEALNPRDNQVILDMTFGAGGHSKHIMDTASVKLICLDRDPVAYKKAQEFAECYKGSVTPLLGRFSEMKTVFEKANIKKKSLDAILIDAGCSSMQMDSAARGFSINKDGPLDMRMDGNRYPNQPTAADIVNILDVPSLVQIFKIYGEEKKSPKIAQALFDARYLLKSINTTHELADLIRSTLFNEKRLDKLQRPAHVATKIFQALRIFVNNELNELDYGMDMAYEFLKPGGRLVALTFHSLEDRIVKRHLLGVDMNEPGSEALIQLYSNAFASLTKETIDGMYSDRWSSIYKHVIKPTSEEVNCNPRSRSAKLRAAKRN